MKRVLFVFCFSILLMTSCTKNNNQLDKINQAAPTISSHSILDVKILDVSFYDEKGKKLNPTDGWIPLQKKTKIIVSYSGSADQIDYIFTPTGTETYNLQRIIGNSYVGPNDTKAEFIWTPAADQSLGYINISINQGNYSVKSDLIKVIYQVE